MNDSLINFGPNLQTDGNFTVNYERVGEVDDWISDELIDQVKRFVNYAVKILDINSIWSKFKKLRVIFEETESEELDGLCLDNNDEGVVKIFLYDLISDAKSIKNLLTTVAHELVHVRQFCDRRLSRIFKRVRGKVIGCYSWSDTGEIYYGEENVAEYRGLPWEVEAFALQDVIVSSYNAGISLDEIDATKNLACG